VNIFKLCKSFLNFVVIHVKCAVKRMVVLHKIDINKSDVEVFLIIFLSFFVFLTSKSQTTLDYYLEKAYANNPTLKELSNSIKINLIEKELITKQYTSPSVSLTSNYFIAPYFNSDKRIIGLKATPEAIGYEEAITNGGQYSLLLNVEKNLFNNGTVEAYQKEFDAATEKNNYEISAAKHQIEHDVTAQYLACFQQIQFFKVNEEIVKVIEDELNIVKNLVENGAAKQTDYLQLEVEADNLRINSNQILGSYYTELGNLNILAGISDTAFQNLEPVILETTGKNDESNFFKGYTLDSMIILAAGESFGVKYKPAVNVYFNTGLNAIEVSDIQRKFGMSAGFNFSWILYDGNQESLVKQKSSLSLMNISNYKANYLKMRDNQLAITTKQADITKKNLEDINKQLEKYRSLLEALRLQISAGQSSVVDYLTSLRNYLELQKSEISMQINDLQLINEYNYWNW
jgi:outer membrane protein TolC